jgi:hypothetical protein
MRRLIVLVLLTVGLVVGSGPSAVASHNSGTQIATSTSTAAGSGTVGWRYWYPGESKWVVLQLERGESSCCFPNFPGVQVYVPSTKDVVIAYSECSACRTVFTSTGWHTVSPAANPQHVWGREFY